MPKNEIKEALVTSVPVMAGYIVLGMGFGILMHNMGYGLEWTFMSSAFVYAGSLQFASVDLIATQASFLTIALTSIIINARHMFYSIALFDNYKNAGKYKPYMIFALTDETYSLICSTKVKPELNPYAFYFYLSMFNQIWWIIGSLMGAAIGEYLPFDTTGIEFSMTAIFLASFVSQWMDTKNHVPALSGVIITVLCLVIFGKSNFLIPSMIGITAVLMGIRKKGEV